MNKQKFLAELGRLLTFMYEEDRVQALAMYTAMFDETADEPALLRLLVSPTRQAVNLARTYDARERKLQAHSQTREGNVTVDEEPAYVRAINNIRQQAAALGTVAPKVSDDQISLFAEPAPDAPLFRIPETEPVSPPEAPAPVPEKAETPPPEEPASGEKAEAEETPAEKTETEAEAPHGEEPVGDVEQVSDALDAFLADFTLPAEVAGDSGGGEAAASAALEEGSAALENIPPVPAAIVKPVQKEAAPAPTRTVLKPRVPLLILFLLLAIPITLLCIGILLLPTLLCLSLAIMTVFLGIEGLGAAFGSFSVFADILLVLGCALVLLALGLLLFWTFIWFVGGAIPALIRGVIALGRKWCYKEVPVS